MFNITPAHADIFDWVDHGFGNLIISAVAGSGKTSTGIEVLKRIPDRDLETFLPPRIVFLAFNKNIAETLASRCPKHVACSTFHSLGLRALKPLLPKGFKVEGRKCAKLVWNLMDRQDPDVGGVIRLVSLLKGQVEDVDPMTLVRHHDLDLADTRAACQIAQRVLALSNNDLLQIDFDDMLYLAVRMNAPFTPQDWVMVDEAQDTNDIQLEILSRLQNSEFDGHASNGMSTFRSTTRFLFVGDPHQAIYGFRGANAESMDRIRERFGCAELPLSVSYRCSKAVVKEAQRVLEERI